MFSGAFIVFHRLMFVKKINIKIYFLGFQNNFKKFMKNEKCLRKNASVADFGNWLGVRMSCWMVGKAEWPPNVNRMVPNARRKFCGRNGGVSTWC